MTIHKFIDSGGYGCIYSGIMRCNKKQFIPNDNKLYVSKLLKNINLNEINIARYIYPRINNSNKYFILAQHICNSQCNKTRSINVSETELNKCKFYNSKKGTKNMILFFYEKGDIPLDEFKPRKNIEFLWYPYIIKNLIKGIKLLSLNFIVHNDIKENNIMLNFNNSNNFKNSIPSARFIDFGLSYIIDKESLKNVTTNKDKAKILKLYYNKNKLSHIHYPVEVSIIYYLLKKYNVTNKSIIKLKQVLKTKLKSEYSEEYINKLLKKFIINNHLNYSNIYKFFIETWAKVDIYSLGYIIINICNYHLPNDIILNTKLGIFNLNLIKKKLNILAMKMTNIDPYERPYISTCLKETTKIISSLNI